MRTIVIIISAIMLMINVSIFAKEYTVFIDNQNNDEILEIKIDSGKVFNSMDDYTIPTPTKDGFVFNGWKDSTYFNEPLDKDSVKLIAQWQSIPEVQNQSDVKIESKLKTLTLITYIACGVAALALLLAILALLLLLKSKKNFRSNLLRELNDVKDSGRLDAFIKRVAEKAKPNLATPQSSNQPVRIDEQHFKQLFEAYWANKQNVSVGSTKPQEQPVLRNQPQFLYADVVKENSFFNRVTEEPTNDSIFELKLEKVGDTKAKVTVYKEAEELVKQRPEFLENCDVQNFGNTNLTVKREGVAIKEDGNKWRITSKPEIEIR